MQVVFRPCRGSGFAAGNQARAAVAREKEGWADYPFSFHDSEELGPAILW
jgi:hypothetical protein